MWENGPKINNEIIAGRFFEDENKWEEIKEFFDGKPQSHTHNALVSTHEGWTQTRNEIKTRIEE